MNALLLFGALFLFILMGIPIAWSGQRAAPGPRGTENGHILTGIRICCAAVVPFDWRRDEYWRTHAKARQYFARVLRKV